MSSCENMYKNKTIIKVINDEFAFKILKHMSTFHDNHKDFKSSVKKKKEELAKNVALTLITMYSNINEYLKVIVECHLNYIEKWLCRTWRDSLKESSESQAAGIIVVDAKTVEGSRFLVGSSSGVLRTVFEVGLAWDYMFDLPYIPGSSLKGAMRASAEALLGDGDLVSYLFGSEKNSRRKFAGCLEVFDAYPVEAPNGLLDLDVITPHYYEGGNVKESEIEAQPIPVVHVSIAPGVKFRFIIAHRCSEDVLKRLSEALRSIGVEAQGMGALAALLGAALLSGVGARTGKGYGVFMLEPDSMKIGCR